MNEMNNVEQFLDFYLLITAGYSVPHAHSTKMDLFPIARLGGGFSHLFNFDYLVDYLWKIYILSSLTLQLSS